MKPLKGLLFLIVDSSTRIVIAFCLKSFFLTYTPDNSSSMLLVSIIIFSIIFSLLENIIVTVLEKYKDYISLSIFTFISVSVLGFWMFVINNRHIDKMYEYAFLELIIFGGTLIRCIIHSTFYRP